MNEPILINVPASLFEEVRDDLFRCGYTLDSNSTNNMYRMKRIPEFIRKREPSHYINDELPEAVFSDEPVDPITIRSLEEGFCKNNCGDEFHHPYCVYREEPDTPHFLVKQAT